MANKKTEGKSGAGKAVAIGTAVVAGLGALAGAYFLYGTEAGKKKRKEIKGWMLKAKGEVLEKIEHVKDLTEDKYKAAVDSVMMKYNKLKKEHGPEIELLTRELMSYWNQMKKTQTKKTAPRKSAKKASAPKK